MHSVLLFLKAARSGQVKTRLAQSVGQARALQVYQALVERQCAALPQAAHLEVYFTPKGAELEMQQWLGLEKNYYPQSEGGLGVRLHDAVRDAFKRGAQSVMCIGGDCPQLDEAHFLKAAQMLDEGHDLVFGPSEDGGYYLIALRAPYLELFIDIPWSTRDTLKASLNTAKKLKLKVGMLETLYDVDEVSELERALADGCLRL